MAIECSPAFLADLSVSGFNILSTNVSLVVDYDISQTETPNHGTYAPGKITFCNALVTYTHPGDDHAITVEVWLPDDWNERLLAVGGGGWNPGRIKEVYDGMGGHVSHGYASATTDAGLADAGNPETWALDENGEFDMVNIENWGVTSLGDMVRI